MAVGDEEGVVVVNLTPRRRDLFVVIVRARRRSIATCLFWQRRRGAAHRYSSESAIVLPPSLAGEDAAYRQH